jgi:hypothetical protein
VCSIDGLDNESGQRCSEQDTGVFSSKHRDATSYIMPPIFYEMRSQLVQSVTRTQPNYQVEVVRHAPVFPIYVVVRVRSFALLCSIWWKKIRSRLTDGCHSKLSTGSQFAPI